MTGGFNIKILLINPPFYRFSSSHNNHSRLGLGYLSAILLKEGHEVYQYNADFVSTKDFATQKDLFDSSVDFVDAINDPGHPIYTEVCNTIIEFAPDIIGITVMAGTVIQSQIIARRCHQLGIRTIIGGPMVTLALDELIKYDYFDQLVPGEAEKAIVQAVSHPSRRIIVGMPTNDINKLPFPTRDNFITGQDEMTHGSILSARGCPFKCKYCFIPGTLVQLENGVKPIEGVVVGDKVLNHMGGYDRVTETFKREYVGEIVGIKPQYLSLTTWSTPEHPYLTDEGWKAASEIERGTLLVYPYLKTTRSYAMLDLIDIVGRFKCKHPLPDHIEFDSDIALIFGYYLAEGGVSKHRNRPNSYTISWTFSHKERNKVEFIEDYFRTKYGLKSTITSKKSTHRIAIANTMLALLFKNLFGTGSQYKKLPEQYESIHKDRLSEILRGWLEGDGYKNKSTNNICFNWEGSTISPSLALNMYRIATILGLSPALYRRKNRKGLIDGREIIPSTEFAYVVKVKGSIPAPGTKHLAVYRIEHDTYYGSVHNLEVENSNSYTANGIAVHNCAHWIMGGEVRFRSAKNVADELEYLINTFGQRTFRFFDDTFTLNKKRVYELCTEIINRKLDIEFLIETRVDCLDKDIIIALKEAGMTRAKLGIESGSPKILKIYKPQYDKTAIREIIKTLKENDIEISLNWMFGFPEETDEDLQMSIDFARELNGDWNTISSLAPYYGTDLFDELPEEKKKDWKNYYHTMKTPIMNDRLGPELIEEFLGVNE